MQFRRPNLHASTVVVMGLMAAALLLTNVYGRHSLTLADVIPIFCEQFEHGWPATFIERNAWEDYYPSGERRSPWRFFEKVKTFRPIRLLADVTVCLGLLFVSGAIFETWRRRRGKVYQLHLIDLFIVTGAVSGGFGFYAYHRSQHRAELAVLKDIDSIERQEALDSRDAQRMSWPPPSSGVGWRRVDFGWRNWEDRSTRVFDRVVGIDITQRGLNDVVRLRELRLIRMETTEPFFSSEQLMILKQLPHLEGLYLSNVTVSSPGGTAPHFRLPSLPRLRGLTCEWSQFRGDGLENLAALEVLILGGRDIGDEALRSVGAMPNLRHLSLGMTRITDDGLRHLARLNRLEWLSLDDTEVSDEGIKQLAALTKSPRAELGRYRNHRRFRARPKTAHESPQADSRQYRHHGRFRARPKTAYPFGGA